MSLLLKTVQASQGTRWISDAFRLFARRPLAFTGMSLAFFFAAMLARGLPLLGALLPLMAMPLLSLGFMVASQSALLDGPVHPRQFIEPLRTDAVRRRALLLLCLSYAVAMVVLLLLADAVSDHAWARMQALGAKGPPDAVELEALMPDLARGGLLLGLLGSLLSVAYWHAPALVHWGGQGVKQALFSSTLAVWRAKGAFALYMLAWFGVLMFLALLLSALLNALSLQDSASLASLPLMTVLSAVFYISVLFTFNDSFGGTLTLPPVQPPG